MPGHGPSFPRFNIPIFWFLFLIFVMMSEKRVRYNRARKSVFLFWLVDLYHVIGWISFIL